MATGRSFAEFAKDKYYNGMYQAAEEYVNENWESLNLYTKNVHRIGAVEMIDGQQRLTTLSIVLLALADYTHLKIIVLFTKHFVIRILIHS